MASMGIGEIGEALRKSTVQVRAGRSSSGSGVVWTSNGTIVSNAHVVGSGKGVQVELWDGRTFPAKVESRDDALDLARLRIQTLGLAAIAMRDSRVRPGELVVAVGNPLGFTGALTTGVAHAVGP